MQTSDHYLNLFGQSIGTLEALCNAGLSRGGDWCDLFFESSRLTELNLRDSAVSSGGTHEDFGCGIRVLSGEHTGYAYSENTDKASLMQTAIAAANISSGQIKTQLSPRINARGPVTERYRMEADWRDSGVSDFAPFLEKLDEAICSRDSRVEKVLASLSCFTSDVMMFNSLGELRYETRPLASLSATVICRQGDKTEARSVSRSYRMGVEFLGDSLIQELADEALEGLDDCFAARRPKGGRMDVVMGAGASGILLHEAMGHAFEADFNRKGQSVFADKMGCRVCRSGINIVDDGTIPGCRGSINFDDEGVDSQKTYMVQDGILTSYLHDRISAKWYGVAPTGNGRRESFRYEPLPRMRTTYMESGPDGTAEDIIASVKKGIYVDQFANGQVKIGEGDFTFYVKRGYLIEDGRLTLPVKDININGNGPEALRDICAVAGDLKISHGTWTCGKGQSCEVSCGIPTVLVKGLTVGGE